MSRQVVATAVVYTIVVTNISAYAVSGTVNDTFPAAVQRRNLTCAASGGSSCVASGSGNVNTIATLAPGGNCEYTGQCDGQRRRARRQRRMSLPFTFLTDATPANNSPSNTILIRPSVSKAFGAARFARAVIRL